MGRPPPREGVWDAPEMAKLALVPGWSTGRGSELGVWGGEQDMGALPPSLPALWAAVGEKGCGTIFSWSVPWQEGRAEKHGAGRGAGQGEGKEAGCGLRKGQRGRKETHSAGAGPGGGVLTQANGPGRAEESWGSLRVDSVQLGLDLEPEGL